MKMLNFSKSSQQNPWLIFLFGLLTMLIMVLLSGAVETSQTPLTSNRYQLAAWGGQLGASSGGFGAFLTDTVTGETKMVYTRMYGDSEKGKVAVDQLGKKFISIE
nr:hypothetical protein [Desulfobulbaceae bacterium]